MISTISALLLEYTCISREPNGSKPIPSSPANFVLCHDAVACHVHWIDTKFPGDISA